MKSTITYLLLSLLIINKVYSQATDNLGNDLFVTKTKSGVSFPLTTTGFSFNFLSSFDEKHKNRLTSYYTVATQDEVTTYKQSKKDEDRVSSDKLHATDVGNWYNPFFINLKVSNLATKSFNQFFSPTNQPTIQLEIGAIRNSVLMIQKWDKLKETYGFLGIHEYDLFYSLFANTSCINYVDTTNTNEGRIQTSWFTAPKYSQVGFKANFNGYWNRVFAIALTAKIFYGLPLDTDPSYQASPFSPIIKGNSLFYKPNMSTGKYGGYINDPTYNGRASVAVPIFLNFLANEKPGKPSINKQTISKLYLLPSYAPYGIFNNVPWTHQIGCSLNLLSQGYGGDSSTVVQAGGIGVDLLTAKTHTGWGSPIFYISGTFNLGSLVKQPGVEIGHEGKPNPN